MSEQPEALRLADAFGIQHWTGLPIALHVEAAAELRRLHEVNAELLEALLLADAMLSGANMDAKAVEKKVRAALAKATGEQP